MTFEILIALTQLVPPLSFLLSIFPAVAFSRCLPHSISSSLHLSVQVQPLMQKTTKGKFIPPILQGQPPMRAPCLSLTHTTPHSVFPEPPVSVNYTVGLKSHTLHRWTCALGLLFFPLWCCGFRFINDEDPRKRKLGRVSVVSCLFPSSVLSSFFSVPFGDDHVDTVATSNLVTDTRA